ncbi:MAG: GNAT family N-acetyltransferase, partial [Actinomycetota bacterium]|nr:GNAT family N-acetyltransferase [Actinomycetota bacterium]
SVYVVLDATAANTALVAEQSAAADLLRQLPGTVRTAVATSARTVPAPRPGNAAALRTLAAVKPNPTMVVEQTLNRIVTASMYGERRLIVLMTSCPTDSQIDISPLKAALDSGTSQLDIVGFGGACRSRLMSLARDRGGVIDMPTAASQLTAAVDRIAYDTLGQYRLSPRVFARGKPMTVRVSFAGTDAMSEVRVPTSGAGAVATGEPTTAPSVAGTRRRHSTPLRLPIAAVALLTGLTLVAVAARQIKGRLRGRTAPILSSRLSPPTTRLPPGGLGDPEVSGLTLADVIRHARGLAAPTIELERVANPATAEPAPGSPGSPAAAEPSPDAGTPAGRPEDDADPPRMDQLLLPASGLSDGKIRVRLPRRKDAADLQAFAESEGGLADDWVPRPVHDSSSAYQALVDSWLRDWNGDRAATGLGLVIDRTSQSGMIGFISLRMDAEAVNVACGIAPAQRGRGYAKAALRLVANWLAEQESVRRIEAKIPMRHQASRSVARAVGFVPTGVQLFDVTSKPVLPNVLYVFERRVSQIPQQTDRRGRDGPGH